MMQHPAIDPVALQLGPLAIHWYGLTYLLAFALFWWLGLQRLRREPFASMLGPQLWQRRDVEDLTGRFCCATDGQPQAPIGCPRVLPRSLRSRVVGRFPRGEGRAQLNLPTALGRGYMPARAVALPGVIPSAPGLPRALCGTYFCRSPQPVRPRLPERIRSLHPPRWPRHQPLSQHP